MSSTILTSGNAVPSSSDVDLSAVLVPFGFSQGPRPLCLPFAVSAAHQIARTTLEAYSPEALWNTCVKNQATADSGTSLAAVAIAARDTGQPVLSVWPYDGALGSGTEVVPPAAVASPWDASSVDLLDTSGGVEVAIKRALTLGRPVLLIIEVSDEFTFVTGDSIVAVPESIPEFQGLHAIVIVGTMRREGVGPIYRVLNIWGRDWADGGFTWLSLDYIARYGYQAATLSV